MRHYFVCYLTRNNSSTVSSVTYLHVIYSPVLSKVHCVVYVFINPSLASKRSVTSKTTFYLTCSISPCPFHFFQMVYNLPDESCFLISTVKGEFIMHLPPALHFGFERSFINQDLMYFLSRFSLLQMNWAKDSI